MCREDWCHRVKGEVGPAEVVLMLVVFVLGVWLDFAH